MKMRELFCGIAGIIVLLEMSEVSSELLTWLVGKVSAFCFKKARVFLFLPIGKADRFRSAPQ